MESTIPPLAVVDHQKVDGYYEGANERLKANMLKAISTCDVRHINEAFSLTHFSAK